MNTKKTTKKLALSIETVRQLSPLELGQAIGAGGTTNRCTILTR
ncbi:MAG TPA: hypothetical protein VH877_12825 [Polyangia bacterium]|jgi:hypothetical protein|nr:hypothetical protein [Polyangia bacterium]